MTIALNNRPEHLVQLCEQLELGNARDVPTQVPGGFHHRMWCLETDRGRYAVKQLSPDTDLANPDTRSHYDMTEAIAERFAGEGVPALHAFGRYGQYLRQLDDAAYLAYPWTDASALDKADISSRHALVVAGILATMHGADIVAPHPRPVSFALPPEQQIITLTEQALACDLPQSELLQAQLPAFLDMLTACSKALPVLEQHKVISHGDLDQKNVLWDAGGQPLVIDWESAGMINPTYEILLEALDWGGITSHFEAAVFHQVIEGYTTAGGTVEGDFIGPAFDAILGEWLNWMMYNLGRIVYLESEEQRTLGAEQLDFCLEIILRLYQQREQLQTMAANIASR